MSPAIAAANPGTDAPLGTEKEPTQIGGWFGPRVYSDDSRLGYIEDAPFHPVLGSTIAFGARVARPFFPWLVPEIELAFAGTKTNAIGGADPANIFWIDPRIHMRFELMPDQQLQPFVVVGGGAPIALSSARKTFNSGIVGDGYVGGGVRFDSGKGFVLRFDARVSILPGVDHLVTVEGDVGLGIEFPLGTRRHAAATVAAKPVDTDGDGIPDDKDQCGDRPEDKDDFDDLDGCPDIDNDLDRVLDIADKCLNVPETYNGYDDDDGCPDTVPDEVDALRGTIEGLIYAEGETRVRESAMKSLAKIAKLMIAHPSIRVVLVGHTDDREAKQFAEGQDNADLAALAADLSRARAQAARQALIAQGIASGRIDAEGQGAEDPVADNAKRRGRLANRRVEIKLYVPPSSR
ncbi:MAG TPA: OmpA family protein [Kofleriaceae bacterium]|nr:OmpA family protein [Kofleriaceae bacterium]